MKRSNEIGKHLRSAGIILRNQQGNYLLVLGRTHNKWSFPKGHIEENESWHDCAQRETLEETGLTVTIPDNAKHWFANKSIYFFIGPESIQGKPVLRPRDKHEIVRATWFSKDELLKLTRDLVNGALWKFLQKIEKNYNVQRKN